MHILTRLKFRGRIRSQCGVQVTIWGSGHNVGFRSQYGVQVTMWGSGHNVGFRSQGDQVTVWVVVSHFYRIKEQVSCFLVLLSSHDIGLDEVLVETICSTPKGHLVCYTRGIQDYTIKYKVIQD